MWPVTSAAAHLTDADYRRLAELRFRLRSFLAFSEQAARSAGLNPQQHQLLLAVRAAAPGALTVGALAGRLVLRHHSAVELVDRLEKKGLVRRARETDDRRVASVHLTSRGEKILTRLSVAHREELRTAGPDLAAALLAVIGTTAAAGAARRAKRSAA